MPLPRRFSLALAFAFPMTICSFTLAAPPSDGAIDALITKIESAKGETGAATRQAKRDAAKDELKSTPLAEATLAQLKKINEKRLLAGNTELFEAVDARLVDLAKESGLDGARAAEMRLVILPPVEPPMLPPAEPNDDARKARQTKLAELVTEARKAREAKLADLTERALNAPAVKELFKSGGGEGILRAVAGLSAETLQSRNMLDRVVPYITSDLSPSATMVLSSLIQPLVGAKESLGQEKFDSIRTSILKAAESALPKAMKLRDEHAAKLAAEPKKEGEEGKEAAKAAEIARNIDEGQITRLKDLRALASGPWARGELVDHPAPAIAFTWSSGEKPIKSFADLKGKVVLVDFWATWCGPCVAAFPKMRELQTRYAGYPVVILGVTSDQGFSMDRTDKKKAVRIDCKGDPGKEHELMKGFMKDLEMTWTVAFSEQNVFNPDFGVRGIPHMAIIDPKGIVRFGHLFPPNVKEESDHIDALLKEAKLPYPENPYVEPKKDEPKNDNEKKDEGKKPDGKKG